MSQDYSTNINNNPNSWNLISPPTGNELSFSTSTKLTGKKVLMPSYQVPFKNGFRQVLRVPAENVNASVFNTTGAFTDIFIRSGTIPYSPNEFFLEFDMTVASAIRFMAMDFCYLRIEISRGGGAPVYQTIYPHHAWMFRVLTNDNDEWFAKMKYSMQAYKYYGFWEETQKLPAGTTRRVRLLIPTTFLNEYFNRKALKDDILFRIFWAPIGTNGVIRSGSVSDITVSNIQLYIESFNYADSVANHIDSIYLNNTISNRYSDVIFRQYPYNSVAPGNQLQIQLTGLTGLFSHLLVFINNQGASGAELLRFKRIDSLNIRDDSNRLLYNNGDLTSGELLYYLAETGYNDVTRFMYIYGIDFGSSIPQAMENGIISGSFAMNGKYFLDINVGQNYVPRIFTLTVGSVGTTLGGSFYFQYSSPIFGTCQSDAIAYNATAAQIKAAIEAMFIYLDQVVTVTVSGALVAGASITITENDFTLASSDEMGMLTCISNLVDSVTPFLPVTINTSLSQSFVPGWDAISSNPNVVVNVLGFRIQEFETTRGEATIIM